MFLTLWRFLLGLLITLIPLLASVPRETPLANCILTKTSTRLRFSSASLICKCFETHLPTAASSVHSKTPVCLLVCCSPEIWMVKLGGALSALPVDVGGDDDALSAASWVVHQEVPDKIVVGGGHKNLKFMRVRRKASFSFSRLFLPFLGAVALLCDFTG